LLELGFCEAHLLGDQDGLGGEGKREKGCSEFM
jgi:hypothetical protein